MLRSDVRPAFKLHNALAAVGFFAVCVSIAGLAQLLTGSGRDVRPTSALLALLVVITVAGLVGWRRYRVAESLAALVIVQFSFVAAIGWFGYGGLPRPDRFFFSWFVPGNLFIALPWLTGTALGAWRSRRTAATGDER